MEFSIDLVPDTSLVLMASYSNIDLHLGYHHIRVKLEDILKTNFRTRYGYYEYSVMMFGMFYCAWSVHGIHEYSLSSIFIQVCGCVYR